MARTREVMVTVTDHVDGGEATETVAFPFDGINHEIDLSANNARARRADLTRWTEHARRHSARRPRGPAPKPASAAATVQDAAGSPAADEAPGADPAGVDRPGRTERPQGPVPPDGPRAGAGEAP